MARWKLTEAHYLKVPGTKWEYTETNRVTGRPMRTQFDVPLYISPHDDGDLKEFGQPPNGDIVVTNAPDGKFPKDVEFLGPPSVGMVPLDDEAKAQTAVLEKRGLSVTQGLDSEDQNASYVNRMLSGLIDQMTDMKVAPQAPAPGMVEFMATMAGMMQKQTEILERLAVSSRRNLA